MSVVIISDKMNRSGFRVLPSGINIENYNNNPIVLFMHGRAWDKESLPIARLENLRVENGSLIADDPIFDEDDEFALKVKKKWDKGMLNAVSAGLSPTTVSEDPSYLQQGQTRPTIVTSELLEVSIVDIPKDQNAVRLSLGEGESIDKILPTINLKLEEEMDLKNIGLKLGLGQNATEAEILAAIDNKNTTIEQLKADKVTELLSSGEAAGVITDDNKAEWEKLAKADFAATSTLLKNAMPKEAASEKEEVTVMKVLAAVKGNAVSVDIEGDKSKWGFNDWSKNDPEGLNQLRLNQPDEYQKLINAIPPKVNGFTIEK